MKRIGQGERMKRRQGSSCCSNRVRQTPTTTAQFSFFVLWSELGATTNAHPLLLVLCLLFASLLSHSRVRGAVEPPASLTLCAVPVK